MNLFIWCAYIASTSSPSSPEPLHLATGAHTHQPVWTWLHCWPGAAGHSVGVSLWPQERAVSQGEGQGRHLRTPICQQEGWGDGSNKRGTTHSLGCQENLSTFEFLGYLRMTSYSKQSDLYIKRITTTTHPLGGPLHCELRTSTSMQTPWWHQHWLPWPISHICLVPHLWCPLASDLLPQFFM